MHKIKTITASIALSLAISPQLSFADAASDQRVRDSIESFFKQAGKDTKAINYTFDSSSYDSSKDETHVYNFKTKDELKDVGVTIEHIATRGTPNTLPHQTYITGLRIEMPEESINGMHPKAHQYLSDFNKSGGANISYSLFQRDDSVVSSYKMSLATLFDLESVSEINVPNGFDANNVMAHIQSGLSPNTLQNTSGELPKIKKAVLKITDTGFIDSAIAAYNEMSGVQQDGMNRQLLWNMINMQISGIASSDGNPKEVSRLLSEASAAIKAVLMDRKSIAISYSDNEGLSPNDITGIMGGNEKSLKGLRISFM